MVGLRIEGNLVSFFMSYGKLSWRLIRCDLTLNTCLSCHILLLTRYFPYCVETGSLTSICVGTIPGYWTSGQRRTLQCVNDPFVWKNYAGTEVALTYTNWASGQPSCGGGSEFCIQLSTSAGLDERWNDAGCDQTLCAMCEMDL